MELIVAMTYGRALFEAANELDMIDQIREEIIEVDKVFEREIHFVMILNNPAIPHSKKRQMVRNVFEGRICEQVLSLLLILIEKDRLVHYHNIIKEYKKLVYEHRNQGKGTVYSVTPLTPEQLAKFEEETSALLREKVHLKNKIDSNLIGGVKILVEGKIIDASLRGRLDSLYAKINTN